jgi:hypothetical protein
MTYAFTVKLFAALAASSPFSLVLLYCLYDDTTNCNHSR